MDVNASFDLPEDVLRLIFESFATHCDKNDAIRLLPVSRDVKTWVEPRIYSKVVLKSSKQVFQFSDSLRGDFAFCRPARHVRSLWLLSTESVASLYLRGVPEQCPNLVHFAFDGKRAPFSSTLTTSGEQSCLSRLTICSPSLLDVAFYKESPPIQWEHLTHLHILGPGDVNDYTLYDQMLQSHLAQLNSLEHICIELTYPSPETELFKYTFFSETALFYIYLKEGLIRDLFVQLPLLRKVLIKTSFTYPRFRVLWDDLRTLLKDEPRVVFEMKPLPNQDLYESTLPCSSLSGVVWQTLLLDSLEGVEQLWTKDS